jgi:hypothetical protein
MVLRSRLFERPVNLHHYDTTLYFQHLEEVTFTQDYNGNIQMTQYKNPPHVQPFFYLPKIKHLSISMDTVATWTWPTPNRPNVTTIRSLELADLRGKTYAPYFQSLEMLEGFAGNFVSMAANSGAPSQLIHALSISTALLMQSVFFAIR